MNRRWRARTTAVSLALLVAACTARAGAGPGGGDGQPPSPAPGCLAPGSRTAEEGVSFQQSVHTLEDGSPVRISVLTVRQDARADVEAGDGGSVQGTDTVRDIARRAQAVAAVNGTFFDMDSARYAAIRSDSTSRTARC